MKMTNLLFTPIKNRLTISQPVFAFIVLFFFSLTAFSQSQPAYHVLVGTYTKGKSKGIQVYSYDSKTGKMAFEHEVPLSNPSYLCLSPDNKLVYAVSEENGKDGSVTAFTFDARTGELHQLNALSSGGIAPCYVSTDHTGKLVFVANYSSGTVTTFHTGADGSLLPNPEIITNAGSSKNAARQDHAHAHSAVVSPDNKFLFTADLGTDKEMVYKIDAADVVNPLTPSTPAFYTLPAGNGPRHFIFDATGKFAYLIQELSGTVTTYAYSNGTLDSLQSVPLVNAGVTGKIGAADIHLSADRKFLYASNRGDFNTISCFSVNRTNGLLTYQSMISSFGKAPRNFAISPDGKFVIVGNQNSDDAYVLPRDTHTGKLSPYIQKLDIGAPVCLKFVKKL